MSPDSSGPGDPGGERSINGSLNLKYSRPYSPGRSNPAPDDPHVIELSLSNIGNIRTHVEFPTFYMTGEYSISIKPSHDLHKF